MESTQHQTPNLAGLLVRIAVFDMEAFFLHPNDASTASRSVSEWVSVREREGVRVSDWGRDEEETNLHKKVECFTARCQDPNTTKTPQHVLSDDISLFAIPS